MIISSQLIEKELNILQSDSKFIESVQAIKPGKFKRDLTMASYQKRVDYTIALRNFVYNPAVLNVIYTNKELKEQYFRTFGYKGNLDFTIYPQSWLRDLPLLDIGEKAYLADGIVSGTNQVSTDQQYVQVGPISIGARTIFDQGCMVGYQTSIGTDCIIGIKSAIGIKGSIGDRVYIGEVVQVGHGCTLNRDVKFGQLTTIGNFSIIEPGVEVAAGIHVPAYSSVTELGIFNRRSGEKAA